MLTAADFAGLAAICAVPTALVVATLRSLTRRMERAEERLEVVERDYVHKRDWLRDAASTGRKLDAVAEKMSAIDAKLDSEFGVAAAVNRLAETMLQISGRHE